MSWEYYCPEWIILAAVNKGSCSSLTFLQPLLYCSNKQDDHIALHHGITMTRLTRNGRNKICKMNILSAEDLYDGNSALQGTNSLIIVLETSPRNGELIWNGQKLWRCIDRNRRYYLWFFVLKSCLRYTHLIMAWIRRYLHLIMSCTCVIHQTMREKKPVSLPQLVVCGRRDALKYLQIRPTCRWFYTNHNKINI